MASGSGRIRIPLHASTRLPWLRRQYFEVRGGPFKQCPEGVVGVKMAEEIVKRCIVDIPTQDYSVPDKKLLYRGLNRALDLLLQGDPLYVGCMGGVGRTGTFLAVLAKTFGIKEPVAYVREHYHPHACETDEQVAYVKGFRITRSLKRKVALARKQSYRRFWTWTRTNLTNLTIAHYLRPSRRKALTNQRIVGRVQG